MRGASRRGAQRQRYTIVGWVAEQLDEIAQQASRISFPCVRYQRDPVAFATEILGVQLTPKQQEILLAVARHKRVAVKSGRRIGKSFLESVIALWFFCSFPDARVVATAPTARQINDIWWLEVRRLVAMSGTCLACRQATPEDQPPVRPCPHSAIIPGEPGVIAATGLEAPDLRKVSGATASKAEGFQGTAGRNLLWLVDEASGVREEIFHAINGNRAGGARLVMFGNPTKNRGEFFDAFHKKKHLFETFSVSSLESPNVVAGRIIVEGLADPDWIEEMREAWGEDSALFKVHILGEFALNEEGRIFGIERLAQAQRIWPERRELEALAAKATHLARPRLYIGLDPAGETGTGDHTALVPRRGLYVPEIRRRRGLDVDGHIVEVRDLVDAYGMPREEVVVVFDATGSVGAELQGRLAAYVHAEKRAGRRAWRLVPVRNSDKAVAEPLSYDRVRDELAARCDRWFRAGGAIPEDAMLEAELNVLEWIKRPGDNLLKVTPKRDIRKELGRSPDSADALELACWEFDHTELRDEAGGDPPQAVPPTPPAPSSPKAPPKRANPYDWRNKWKKRR